MKRYSQAVAAIAAAVALVGCGSSGTQLAVNDRDTALSVAALNDGSMSGAIFTTSVACNGVDVNIYADKANVYLDGGPAHPNAAGLPDGSYYVKVTTPEGTLLGTSIGASNEKPVTVTGGAFETCYQLANIVIKASDGTPGYDDTTNGGGEYKVWVSSASGFANSSSKTDNFKVLAGTPPPPDAVQLTLGKFYDANTNGVWDQGEVGIAGWLIDYTGPNGSAGATLTTGTDGTVIVDNAGLSTPATLPGLYTASEQIPTNTFTCGTGVRNRWIETAPFPENLLTVTLGTTSAQLDFGNVCVGAGGGLTLGYWSNKNGQATIASGTNDLGFLVGLHLVNADGTPASFTDLPTFRSWLLGGTATNMAYMLSVQLAAMELNVRHGFVSSGAVVIAGALPAGCTAPTGITAVGGVTIQSVMDAAVSSLGSYPVTLSGNAQRSCQEFLKNALDEANNNCNFVQTSTCPAPTFPVATQ